METVNVPTGKMPQRYGRLEHAREYDEQHGWVPFTEEEQQAIMEAVAEITNL